MAERAVQSVWMVGESDASRFPRLSGEVTADTVVVGGGITGVTTAWLLSQLGQRVVLLEAQTLGASNTGRSTGNLYGTLSSGLAGLRKHWSAEVVRQMVALRLEAVAWIERTVGELGLDCAFTPQRLYTCIAKTAPEAVASLTDEFTAAAEAGLRPHWLPAEDLPLNTPRGFAIDHQAQFNPYRYTRALAEACTQRGVQVHEHSAVVQIEDGCVATEHGRVRAERIVLATHTPLGLNIVQAEMPIYRECGIAATLAPGESLKGIIWVRDASRSVRGYRALGREYGVVVGERHKPGHETSAQYVALADYARQHLAVDEITHTWSAQQYRSADGLPYVGPVGHDNVFIATGFGADGLTWGTVAARLISESIAGRSTQASEYLSPGRFTPIKSTKGWLAETRVVLDHLVVHRLRRGDLKTLAELPPGEGHLVEMDGEKLGAYRSPEGELTLVSAVCTHMKCQVHWNPVAASWDCPCHGSRFATDGSVIEGPALHPLPRLPTTP